MYPVPWLSVETETPVASEMGTMTEYTVDTDMPMNHVYLYQISAYSHTPSRYFLTSKVGSQVLADQGQQLAMARPIERIFGIARRHWIQNNVPVATSMPHMHRMAYVDEMDGPRNWVPRHILPICRHDCSGKQELLREDEEWHELRQG